MEGSQDHRTCRTKDLYLSLFSKAMSPNVSGSQIYSPVTDLAFGLGELSTSGSGSTPKRRLSLCSDGTPTPTLKPVVLEKHLSASILEDSCMSDEGSPFLSSRFGDLMQSPCSAAAPHQPSSSSGRPKSLFQSTALRRFQSMPVPFCGFDDDAASTPEVCRTKLSLLSAADHHDEDTQDGVPTTTSPAKEKFSEDDDTSQDSGVCVGEPESSHTAKLLGTDFRFAEPMGRAPSRRSSRVLSDETNNLLFSSGQPFSLFRGSQSENSSPVKLQRSSLTGEEDDEDDGFLELVDVDEAVPTSDAPSSISGLFTKPLLHTDDVDNCTPTLPRPRVLPCLEDQENRRPAGASATKRGLFRSPSAASALAPKAKTFSDLPRPRPVSFKRAEPDNGATTPVQNKRRKSTVGDDDASPCAEPVQPRAATLQRCHSETEAMIKSALSLRDQVPNLIGDLSTTYCLPLCRSKHQDLNGISPETLAAVLNGEYDHVVDRVVIVDARYPYEFEGGHIRGALNLYTKDGIIEHFLAPGRPAALRSTTVGKRTIVVFHCEFSSERGPRLCRFLRNKDRDANRDAYPALDFPELYLLENGYKAFYYQQQAEENTTNCVPNTYKPMLHEDHADDLRHYRLKSKACASDKASRKSRAPFRPGLKL